MIYNGIEYQLRPFNLKTKKAYTSIVLTIDKLTKGLIKARKLNLDVLSRYDRRLTELQTAYSQLKAIENPSEEQVKHIDTLTESLDKLNETIKNDTEYQETLNEHNLAYTEATLNVCQTEELIRPFIESVLIGDLSKLDWENDWALDEFCQSVLMDFFSFVAKNRKT